MNMMNQTNKQRGRMINMKYEVVKWKVNKQGVQIYAVREGGKTYFTGLKLTCESKAREYEKLDNWL